MYAAPAKKNASGICNWIYGKYVEIDRVEEEITLVEKVSEVAPAASLRRARTMGCSCPLLDPGGTWMV